MKRHKPRANGRIGLWQDLPGTGPIPAQDLRFEEEKSPLTRPCPHCHATTGQRCTRPTRNGRTDLRGWHPSRLNPSAPETHPAEET